jgi:hypothetical protein
MHRRLLIKWLMAGAGLYATTRLYAVNTVLAAEERITKIMKSDEEWKKSWMPKHLKCCAKRVRKPIYQRIE